MTTANLMRSITIAALVLLSGCARRVPDATVLVIDTSRSITPRAEKAALDAVREQIGRMQRGDRLVIIPITGDAENDAGGRILRLFAPTEREAYDADLRRFRNDASNRFALWTATVQVESDRTDIFGALDAARQELGSLPKGTRRRLILVSDLLEDDGEYDFATDSSLANPSRAHRLASRLRAAHGFSLQGTPLCVGRLASIDYGRLAPERRTAIEMFWKIYLTDGGRPPEIQIDGVGIIGGVDGVGMLAGSDDACSKGSALAEAMP